MNRTPLIAGNWKMYKTVGDAERYIQALLPRVAGLDGVEIAIATPYTALAAMVDSTRGSRVGVYAQNMHEAAEGAFTGEISAPMLRAFFATHVILGHSERRSYFGESDELINKKVLAALKNQLRPILCVGEILAEREAGSTLKVVQTQTERCLEGVSKELAATVIVAYEPVWAIGTGKVATTEQAQEVHAFIRGLLTKLFGDTTAQKVRILYGGSMKPANAPDLLAQKDIDGGLIGGASLEARSFVDLVNAAAAAK